MAVREPSLSHGGGRPDPALGKGLWGARPAPPSPPRTHAHTLTRSNKYGPDGADAPPLASVGAGRAALPLPAKGDGGPYRPRAASAGPVLARAGPRRRPGAAAGRRALRSGGARRGEDGWVRAASAQHAAFAPAQLPAQLATPLLQAAFQALVLLQGAAKEPGQVRPSVGAPEVQTERVSACSAPSSQRTPAPLTSAPSGPGFGPARRAGSPATPAPPAGAAPGAAARPFSASLGAEEAEGQGTPAPAPSWSPVPAAQHAPSMASMARSSRLSSSNLRSKSCSSMLGGGVPGQGKRKGRECPGV